MLRDSMMILKITVRVFPETKVRATDHFFGKHRTVFSIVLFWAFPVTTKQHFKMKKGTFHVSSISTELRTSSMTHHVDCFPAYPERKPLFLCFIHIFSFAMFRQRTR